MTQNNVRVMFLLISQSATGATPTRQLTVVYRPVSSVQPDPRNARTYPRRQLDQLRASILQFGFTNPILVDEAGMLIAGHGRLLAAKDIGLATVPVIELAGLNEAEKKALRLADNKIALNAGWDLEILKLELADIANLDVNFDLSISGFASDEIDVVLKAANDPDDEVIRENGRERRIIAAKAFILQLTKKGLEGYSASARASLASIEKARQSRVEDGADQLVAKLCHRSFGICCIVENLGMAVRLNETSKENVRLMLRPWIVEAALARMEPKQITLDEQGVVMASTRTPHKVNWPSW